MQCLLEALRAVAKEQGVSVALSWQLTKPCVTRIIIGAKNREQLVDDLDATKVKLTAEQVKTLDDSSALPAECPGWMTDWQNRDVRGIAK
jgi:aryl-alcohol dehydrogenase-like predicted oxidoreductase